MTEAFDIEDRWPELFVRLDSTWRLPRGNVSCSPVRF